MRKTTKPSKTADVAEAKAEGVYETVNRKRDVILSNLQRVPLPPEYQTAVDCMEDYLHSQRKRRTVERRFVLAMLYQLTQPVDIGTLHQMICEEQGNVALTTVYTTLELLVQLHLARRVELVSHGMTFFERTLGLEPHGYVVCDQCGAISVLQQPSLLHDLQPQMPRGFVPDDYSLIIHGLCSKCHRKSKSRQRKAGKS